MPTLVTQLSKTFRFEAAHSLPHVPADHKCRRVHGHSYRITIVVRGPVDPHLGWVVDFASLEAAWRPLHDKLDHRLLNDVDGLENPTSEHLAAWIYARYSLDGAEVASVTVAETCTSTCTVSAV
jgi:6-pyruvoyltetrahydropterin/6-carboxytetrahydropterin synthase